MTDPIASVKVIGLGGIGAPVAQAMALFLSFRGLGKILWLIDGDTYEERNRERVLFERCGKKAVVKAQELSRATAERVPVLAVPEYVTPRSVGRLIEEGDVAFLCVDNHASRKLVSNRCRRLQDIVLISGGNDGVENGRAGTFGNVQVYVRRAGRDVTNPLTRFHPELARPKDRRPDKRGCAALTPDAPQLLFTNLAVASAMLGTFHAWLSGTLDYEELYLDLALGRMTPVRRLAGHGRTP
jgi:hypothetical protein